MNFHSILNIIIIVNDQNWHPKYTAKYYHYRSHDHHVDSSLRSGACGLSAEKFVEEKNFGHQKPNCVYDPWSSVLSPGSESLHDWRVQVYVSLFSEPNSEYETFIVMLSLSYCIYDFVACLYFGLADAGLVIHHTLCVLGFGSAILEGYGAIDGIGGLAVAEISNFPMHLRVILRNYGLKYTKSYEFFENTYLLTYILARGLFCPFYLLLPSLQSFNSPILVKIICFSITAQSFYYIIQMTKIVRKKIAQYREMNEKKV